jgi:phosphate transport system substrate-binding protein
MRPRTDVDTALVRAISPQVSAAVDAAYARRGLLLAVTNQECDEILARTPGAIGPTSLTQISTEEKRLVPLAWNGVEPSVANLASGAYPLSKTLLAVTRVPPSPAARRVLEFLASPQAATILERTGSIALSRRAPRSGDGDRRR